MPAENIEKKLYSKTTEVTAVAAALLIRKYNPGWSNKFSLVYKYKRFVRSKGKKRTLAMLAD